METTLVAIAATTPIVEIAFSFISVIEVDRGDRSNHIETGKRKDGSTFFAAIVAMETRMLCTGHDKKEHFF